MKYNKYKIVLVKRAQWVLGIQDSFLSLFRDIYKELKLLLSVQSKMLYCHYLGAQCFGRKSFIIVLDETLA